MHYQTPTDGIATLFIDMTFSQKTQEIRSKMALDGRTWAPMYAWLDNGSKGQYQGSTPPYSSVENASRLYGDSAKQRRKKKSSS